MRRGPAGGGWGRDSVTPIHGPKTLLCMARSLEYRTVLSAISSLEIALSLFSREAVHFLLEEGFITQEVHDDVLDPRSILNCDQKAGKLVTGIRNKVKLYPQSYYTLINHLRQSGRECEGIVNILDSKYAQHAEGD